jgi:integrase
VGRWGRIWRYEGKRATTWRIRYQDATGRRVLETLGPEPYWNRKRAQQELNRRLTAVQDQRYQAPARILFADYALQWLEEILPARGLKPSTVAGYESTVRAHLVPFFGAVHLGRFDTEPDLVDRYIANKMGAGISPKTVHNHLLVLSVMLRHAIRRRLIHTNPVRDCDRPRVEQPDMQILTTAEISRLDTAYRQLQANAESEHERAWWRLAHTITLIGLATGMRRGELLALQWEDVHLVDRQLHVRRALVRGQLTTPKSRTSRRTIHLGPRAAALLERHWAHTPYSADADYVFCHPTRGTPADPSRLSRTYMRPALTAAGITKPFRVFHDLRHTSLTHDAAAGNPHAYIQAKAGHSQGSITERYIHASQLQFPNAAADAERRMFGSG